MDYALMAAIIIAAAVAVPAVVIGSAQMMSYASGHKRSEERKNQLAAINHAQAMANLASITSQSDTQTTQEAQQGMDSTSKKAG